MTFLDSRSLLCLALTNHEFHGMVMQENVWRGLCKREFHICNDVESLYSWRSLYVAAVDGRHSYDHHNRETHIDWMRIGMFNVESGEVVASDNLPEVKEDSLDEANDGLAAFLSLSNVRNGPWIADLHLVRCPVCSSQSCEGTMQTLEARHWELFLNTDFQTGDWKYTEIWTHQSHNHASKAAAGIFDRKRLRSEDTLDLLNLDLWMSSPGDWQPRGKTSKYAAVSSTRLQQNDGLLAKFSIMQAGSDGYIVAIRVAHQLV